MASRKGEPRGGELVNIHEMLLKNEKQGGAWATQVPIPRWADGRRFVVGMSARALTDRGKGIEEFFQHLSPDRAFLKETTFVLIGDGKIRIPAGLDCRFPGHEDSAFFHLALNLARKVFFVQII